MKAAFLSLLCAGTSLIGSELELLPSPPAAFFGGQRTIEIAFRNPTGQTLRTFVSVQLLQATTTTVAPWTEAEPGRSLTLLPRQTSIETAVFDVPDVRAKSRFLLRVTEQRRVLGLVDVWAYPRDPLGELRPLLGGEAVLLSGAPEGWDRLLTASGVAMASPLAADPAEHAQTLAIFGPNLAGDAARRAFERARALAEAGSGVVWIVDESDRDQELDPLYYPIAVGRGNLVVVRASALANLATDPRAQARLLRIAKIACGTEKLALPKLEL